MVDNGEADMKYFCWKQQNARQSIKYQFKRKICKGSLEIFLFMQITDLLADLRCILAVF